MRIIRRTFAIISALVLCLALCSCAVAETAESAVTPEIIERATSVTTPLEQVSSAGDLADRLSIKMSLPQEAENVEYSILRETIAQSVFTFSGMELTFRMSLTGEDISGVFVDFSNETGVSAKNGEISVSVKYNKGAEALSVWYDATAGLGFSLYCPECARIDDFTALTKKLAEVN